MCGGTCRSEEAECSNPDDARSIRKRIEERLGYDAVNRAIFWVSRRSSVSTVLIFAFYAIPYILVLTIVVWIPQQPSIGNFICGLIGFLIAFSIDLTYVRHVVVYGYRRRGALSPGELCVVAMKLFALGVRIGMVGGSILLASDHMEVFDSEDAWWFGTCLFIGLTGFALWLAIMVLGAWLIPDTIKSRGRVPIVISLILFPTIWFVLTSDLKFSSDQVLPSAVHAVCLFWALLAGPVNLPWSACLEWGICVKTGRA